MPDFTAPSFTRRQTQTLALRKPFPLLPPLIKLGRSILTPSLSSLPSFSPGSATLIWFVRAARSVTAVQLSSPTFKQNVNAFITLAE